MVESGDSHMDDAVNTAALKPIDYKSADFSFDGLVNGVDIAVTGKHNHGQWALLIKRLQISQQFFRRCIKIKNKNIRLNFLNQR